MHDTAGDVFGRVEREGVEEAFSVTPAYLQLLAWLQRAPHEHAQLLRKRVAQLGTGAFPLSSRAQLDTALAMYLRALTLFSPSQGREVGDRFRHARTYGLLPAMALPRVAAVLTWQDELAQPHTPTQDQWWSGAHG